jgi:hypothetical protein
VRSVAIVAACASSAVAGNATTLCYDGTRTPPDGAWSERLILRRTIDPEHGTIGEEYLEGSSTRFATSRYELRIHGNRFDAFQLDADGTHFPGGNRKVGHGTFRGPRWRWTSWALESTVADDAGTITATATAGSLHRESRRKDSEDIVMIDDLVAFDCKSFANRVAAGK